MECDGLIIRPHISQCFFIYFQKNCFQNCSSYFQPHYYSGHADGILLLFTSPEDSETFKQFLNCFHALMSLITDNDKKAQCPILMLKLSANIENLQLELISLQTRAS